MFSKYTHPREEERMSKILLKKQGFEDFHVNFVRDFETSKTNAEFHRFRLSYNNRIRQV